MPQAPYESVRDKLFTVLHGEGLDGLSVLKGIVRVSRRDECQDIDFDSPLAGQPRQLLAGLIECVRQEAAKII